LINGASGAVGAYAVQLAKIYGAKVTAVCGTANVALVKSLGADHVIDYRREDPMARRQGYDVIFDAVGKSTFPRCRAALKPNGVYLTTVPSAAIMLQMLWTSAGRGQKAIFTAAGLQQRPENLHALGELFAAGKLRAVIDRSYPLAGVSEAHHYVETGHKKGNVVILVPPTT
jgi:NADPH:quinone reductase-like Zn-dependent oxidoreductase